MKSTNFLLYKKFSAKSLALGLLSSTLILSTSVQAQTFDKQLLEVTVSSEYTNGEARMRIYGNDNRHGHYRATNTRGTNNHRRIKRRMPQNIERFRLEFTNGRKINSSKRDRKLFIHQIKLNDQIVPLNTLAIDACNGSAILKDKVVLNCVSDVVRFSRTTDTVKPKPIPNPTRPAAPPIDSPLSSSSPLTKVLDFDKAAIEEISGKWHAGRLQDNNQSFIVVKGQLKNDRSNLPSISKRYSKDGSYALKAGKNAGSVTTKSRSEIFIAPPGSWYPGQKRYIGFSVYIPSNAPTYYDWASFFQVQNGLTNPAFAMELKRGKTAGSTVDLQAVHRWGYGPSDGPKGEYRKDIGTFEKGKWHDFVMELNFDYRGRGMAHVNYKKHDKWQRLNSYSGKLGSLWQDKSWNDCEAKFGLYIGKGNTGAHEHWFDNVKFSDNIEDAKP